MCVVAQHVVCACTASRAFEGIWMIKLLLVPSYRFFAIANVCASAEHVNVSCRERYRFVQLHLAEG